MAETDTAKELETEPKKRRLRALAFAGGAFDTIMQMGVVHALLVSRGKAPDHVVGISAGAVNAAALAEVMQTGSNLSGRDRLIVRVRKLREILDTYLELPRTFITSALPDAFEINAKRPLKPLELPVHLPDERASRADASRSKAGLIRLMNDLLSLHLTVGGATRIIRRVLAFRQADELSRPAAARDTVVANAVFLWLHIGRRIVAVADIFSALCFAAWSGKQGGVTRWMQSLLPSALKSLGFKNAANMLESRLSLDAATAGQAIQRPIIRTLAAILRGGTGFVLFVALWLTPLLLLLPPAEVIEVLPAVTPIPVDWSEIVRDAQDTVDVIGRAMARLSTEPVGTNLRLVGQAFVPIVAAVGSWIRNLIAVRWVSIAGIFIPLLIAISVERLFYFRPAALFLGTWVVVMSGLAWPRPRFLLLCITVLVIAVTTARQRTIRRRILEHYEIGDAVLSADILQQTLVHCFDPNYHGYAGVASIIDAALKRAPGVCDVDTVRRKALADYTDVTKTDTPIHVAPVAANIRDGQLEILEPQVSVVDALLAATAVVPVFPAREIISRSSLAANETTKSWYIDGLNVSNEPIQPLFRHIRSAHHADPAEFADVETVDIYPVSDVPVDEVSKQEGGYSALVDVGLRALELKQFRDAAMERRLTRLYTRALPKGTAFHSVYIDDPAEKEPQRTFIHAELFPIELEKPARVNRRLFRNPNPDNFKRILRETVADGCRATLEAMLPGTLYTTARAKQIIDWTEGLVTDMTDERFEVVARVRNAEDFPQNLVTASAHAVNSDRGVVMTFHFRDDDEELALTPEEFNALRELIYPRCIDVTSELIAGEATLPGSDLVKGPGLSEICRVCRLNRPNDAKARRQDDTASEFEQQRLRVIPARSDWPQWPMENPSDLRQPRSRRAVTCGKPEPPKPNPRPYEEWLGNRSDRPVISFLFGGGVFRGVFHMGVMNALSEAGLEPDLVAGSSVGSIVAAMIAGTFKETGDARQRRIALLAATFLAIDRLVLTDRLSDFVRGFTLRAAEARFSPHDIDRALRQFDSDNPRQFNDRVRKVAAGLERLFYLSPSELIRMIDDIRMQRTGSMASELILDIQELLERGGLGQEILGSESLSLLIDRHVIREGNLHRFASFREGKHRKIFFLATATNLVQGALEILGAPWSDPNVYTGFGLLASSAFPSVFRPRHAWEVFVRTDRGDDKYIDGGTIDNLPLDAVARFLSEASKSGVVSSRHRKNDVPHLLFTASLEVNEAIYDVSVKELEREATEFLSLMRRAGTFKYNRKIDAYISVQRRLRSIRTQVGQQSGWEPLNMHVLAVKPNWLCGTFGFHPMLGFKRRKQAQSIAHGCAMTLAMLHGTREKRREWYDEWTTRPGETKKELRFDSKASEIGAAGRVTLHPQPRTAGQCWFRTDVVCPFSRISTAKLNKSLAQDEKLADIVIDDVHAIYVECGRVQTHRPA